MVARDLPELGALERILETNHSLLSVRKLCEVTTDGRDFPVYAISLGGTGTHLPAVGFFGGVHGLERIGTQVLLAFLRTLLARLEWDQLLHTHLDRVRLVFVPIVNPAGMWRATRCNPRGVDLMRNAPIESTERVPFLLGGQRFSSRLPWFRGFPSEPMEIESQAVCKVVQENLLDRKFSLAIDCHSGFGMRDRIWFPYAHTASPIRHLAEVFALEELFHRTYPNHNYVFEPQSSQYLTHGDLWDHLYRRVSENRSQVFLPLTLEMGSWLWIRKSPLQLFSRFGFFNPLPAHRLQRVLRRHLLWLEFLVHAASGYQKWMPQEDQRADLHARAYARWYGAAAR